MNRDLPRKEIREVYQPFTTQVNHIVDSRRQYAANHEIKYANTKFGNSGLALAITEDPDLSAIRWSLHFTPEMQTKPIAKPKVVDEQYIQANLKYARMFAAGMLELIEFARNLRLSDLQENIRHFYQSYSIDRPSFYTNRTMLEFARKMFGNDFFVEDKPAEDNVHYSHFELKRIVEASNTNPTILDVAKRFADPNKLKEIQIKEWVTE